jgi:hypothetical protein
MTEDVSLLNAWQLLRRMELQLLPISFQGRKQQHPTNFLGWHDITLA